ncbi:NfeD family protein [Alteribacter natronophilus]|uniref:NfeD family protein n=1 Tax=Alteribacter natronophilus TaxID=2583810 RepID=UPI00110DFB6B|nr:nodulation protein NfeD [Alteribacter natronophilus]TMW74127.1 nodulation protein NfeD [Alteribacter natronophilus]
MKSFRLTVYTLFILTSVFMLLLPPQAESGGEGKIVYYVPVEQAVERGLLAFMERSFEQAAEEGADHIVLEVDTPGGFVDAAGRIASLMNNTDIPITAFVVNEALSAGAYISLMADEIVMMPGTDMGSAAVVDGTGNAADTKAQSVWLARMQDAADKNDRDPRYALAMADETIDLPEYRAGEGQLLTFNASEAYEEGYAEAIASNREELLEYLGLENAIEQEMEISLAEQIARFVTHPIVIPILMSIGSLGLILELYSPGFGIPGFMGISALLLYFFGHMVAGFAGWEAFILFGAGMVLLVIELLVPGFGIFGALGIGAIIGSLFLGSADTMTVLTSVMIAAAVSITAVILLFKYVGFKGPMKRFVLMEATNTEEGYVSNETKKELVGSTGEALTVLRPSGTALINDERLDVVSEGGYIEQGRKVKVISTSGSRIVVRESTEDRTQSGT